MFVDSHCHIDFPDFSEGTAPLLANMAAAGVGHALCVSVSLEDYPRLRACVDAHPNLWASVGVHPDYQDIREPTVDELIQLAHDHKVVAIGETGLDYFRLARDDVDWQRERFRVHIRAAIACRKPLIIHTREAAEDTLRLMREENACEAGGVMHCFTESLAVAEAAMAQGFYISFSGIVTFKNAISLKAVAARVPLDRLLIETDAPYLAPVPHRGKRNEPAHVRHVGEYIAELRGVAVQEIEEATTANFMRLFRPPLMN